MASVAAHPIRTAASKLLHAAIAAIDALATAAKKQNSPAVRPRRIARSYHALTPGRGVGTRLVMRASTSTALIFLSLSLSLAMGCSSTSSGGGAAGGNGSAQSKACLDTIEALARAAERCGGNYQANYDAALQNAAGGDCNKIVSIRDESALRSTCLPSLMALSCPDLTAGKLDASCKAQLQRPASFTPTLGPASAFADEL
jgi:hypothetical protein